MKKILLILALIAIATMSNSSYAQDPYYGFYPSTKGSNYKLFRHNIYNFEVDMPKNWTFGVAGKGFGQVVMMYPESLNTGNFFPSYQTISIGIIPMENITLQEAYESVLLGMNHMHNDVVITQKVINAKINNNKAVNFIYTWLSKTGNTIKEDVFLVEYKSRIYSVTTRTIEPISKEQNKMHRQIVNSFKPIEPVQL